MAILSVLTILLVLGLALGLEIAFAMGVVGTIGLFVWHFGLMSLVALGDISWDVGTSYALNAVPLYILMSTILTESGLSNDLYTGISKWFNRVPGGLAVASQISCSVFAAISGSSVATAYAIGIIAIPEMKKRGYDSKLVGGCLCAGGTLGILIPPSIPMIIYGSLMDQSIGKLFVAGVLPGIILASTFIVYIVVRVLMNPSLAPPIPGQIPWAERVVALKDAVPIVVLVVAVLGGIYTGITTPTEAAAIGVVGSVLVAALMRRLSWRVVQRSIMTAVYSMGMIFAIIIGALVFAHIVSYLHISQAFTAWLLGLDLSRWTIFAAICVLYIMLGCFMETIAILVITIPIIGPMLVSLGFDPIWFGIIMVVLIEMGLVTPPVGLNLYVVQDILHEQQSLEKVIRGVTPFVVLMGLMLFILSVFPQLVLWLPGRM
jgi:C4-dicarboxylate transporter DctM subunit